MAIQPINPTFRRSWQNHLREAVRDVGTLSRELGFSSIPHTWDPHPDFPILVPQPFLKRIKKRDENDPLLRQVVPLVQERETHEGWTTDPLKEKDAVIDTGLLQKYSARVLVIAASACAVNCRYCFRRHFPYEDHRSLHVEKVLEQIDQDTSVSEVILSGGEPLLLSDTILAEYLDRLRKVEHLKRVRIHTRLPVVVPQRVTSTLIKCLQPTDTKSVVVMHFNHPNELDDDVASAMMALREAGVTLLNQSVLLHRVNDSAQVLAELSEKLFQCEVMPYYLHLPDRVQGTKHFDVSRNLAVRIHRELQSKLPGYLVPRLVRETPAFPSKEIISC